MKLYVVNFPEGDCPLEEPHKSGLRASLIRQHQAGTACSTKAAERWLSRLSYLMVAGGEQQEGQGGHGLGRRMGCTACLATSRELRPVSYCEPSTMIVLIFGVCEKCASRTDLMDILVKRATSAYDKEGRYVKLES